MDGSPQEATDARSLIGTNAGKVWQYLNGNGESTPTQICKAVGESPARVNQAIGWLSREGKIDLLKSGKAEKFRLADCEKF